MHFSPLKQSYDVIAKRLQDLPSYAMAAIAERKKELLATGVDVIDLGAGDPDLPPPDIAVRALTEALRDPRSSRYAFQTGSPELRAAIARYMARRFDVTIDADAEVLPLIGSKEGLAHLALATLDPGDVCVVPQPGYPAYLGGATFAGADVEIVPLRSQHDFLVELEEIPRSRLERVRLVYLNYPNNPTGAVAPRDYLERTISVCQKYGIVLAYDNPYVEITFDDYRAPSILEFDGAREVAVEFHSFSKTFCMTGWRLGWAVGNTSVIKALSKVKTYVDTGAFLAIQRAGGHVLDSIEPLAGELRQILRVRRDVLISALHETGCAAKAPKGGMYLWLPLPAGVESGRFSREALEEEGLVVLAGSAFGQAGEGYVRLSFIVDPNRLREAAARFGRVHDRFGGVPS